jgi:hypothetical protein
MEVATKSNGGADCSNCWLTAAVADAIKKAGSETWMRVETRYRLRGCIKRRETEVRDRFGKVACR